MKNPGEHKVKRGFVKKIIIFSHYIILLFLLPVISFAADALVDWGTTHQSIRGFGASTAWSGTAMPAALADLFFRTDGSNIGLSIYRTRIPPDGTLTGEMGSVTEALQRNSSIIVWAAPWSPPAAMKSTDNVNCDVLLSTNYQAYANYLTKYVQTMDASLNSIVNGKQLYALSVQNEPDWNTCSAGYEGCTWTAAQMHSFVLNNLGPAMQASCPDTKLMMPESFGDSLAMSDPTLNDSAAAAYVGIVGEHLYGLGGNEPKTPNAYPLAVSLGKEYWETEFYNNSLSSYDATMTEGLKTAVQIHNALTIANFNAYHYWWMISTGNDNGGLVPSGCATAACAPKTLYCLGNFSKFIRPGYVRIDTTLNPTAGVYISAYKLAATGEFAMVVINTNASITSQRFDLNAMTTTTVTPWLTDASNSLVQQADAPVSGGVFTYNLPASSVVTFIGTGENIATTPTFTPTASPVPATVLLDDMEDGNNTNNWGGSWYDYVDTTGSTIAPQPYVMTAGGDPNSILYCASITGNIVSGGYGGLGTNLNSAGTAVDLTNYIGVQFYVKGSGTYWFQFTQPTITGGYFGTQFTATSTWTLVTALFSNLTQEYGGPAAFTQNSIIALQWANYTTGALNFQVDEVKMLTNVTPTNTPNNTPSFTPTRTPTESSTPTLTLTRTTTYTPTRTTSLTPTPTFTATAVNTNTLTSTATVTPTNTGTQAAGMTFTATATITNTGTYTFTSGATPSDTFTVTSTPTTGPSFTVTATFSPSQTATETLNASPTITATVETPVNTVSMTQTVTSTAQILPSASATASDTAYVTLTQTEINTPAASPTAAISATFTVTPTTPLIPTVTFTPTLAATTAYTATFTDTMVFIPTMTATAAQLPATPTITPVSTAGQDKVILYPVPYNPVKQDLSMLVSLKESVAGMTINIYTVSLRLIKRLELPAAQAGDTTIVLDRNNFINLSNGAYYYSVSAKKEAENLSLPHGVLLIIKQ